MCGVVQGLNNDIPVSLLYWCISYTLSTESGACHCHLLERIIRIIDTQYEVTFDAETTNHVLHYLETTLCSKKACYYYLKVIYYSMCHFSEETRYILIPLLQSFPLRSAPYLVLSAYRLSSLMKNIDALRVLRVQCPEDVPFSAMISIMTEKDTFLVSFLYYASVIAMECDRAQFFFSLFSQFIRQYEYDTDMVVSLLNETSDILPFLLNVCKLLKRNRPAFSASKDYQVVEKYMKRLYCSLKAGEECHAFLYSVKALLRRMEDSFVFCLVWLYK